tara:strand:- start:1731 stop:1949 length:219 start_codon:yes stop_codon:yes gene_type:complete
VINKDCKFNKIVTNTLSNIESWNKKVKKKKYTINNSDSYSLIEHKIYRYLNEYDEGWQVEGQRAKYRKPARF